jgi:hypothetical protein
LIQTDLDIGAANRLQSFRPASKSTLLKLMLGLLRHGWTHQLRRHTTRLLAPPYRAASAVLQTTCCCPDRFATTSFFRRNVVPPLERAACPHASTTISHIYRWVRQPHRRHGITVVGGPTARLLLVRALYRTRDPVSRRATSHLDADGAAVMQGITALGTHLCDARRCNRGVCRPGVSFDGK